MEAFLYQQQQQADFLLDPASYISNCPIGISLHLHQEMSNASSSCFTSHNSSEPCMQEEYSTSSLATLDNKMRRSDGSSLSTGKSKGVREGKIRTKKPIGEKKGSKAKAMKAKRATNEEPPEGYIHVRARRGQATDSHSLAERVRRERISERMKRLQGLVPGCDNVIGKALVLDEIINYVQSLHNQVEFLSMKLASVNHSHYDFGDYYMSQAEGMGSISPSIPSVIHQIEGATNMSIQQETGPAAHFPLHGQGPHSFNQGSGGFLMQVELNNGCLQ